MTEHKLLSPCPFCGEKLFLDIDDEGGGVAILHSLKEKNCFFPSILEIEMPVGTTLEQMIEKINRRPIQESFEHAIVGASLVSAARIQDKVFEIQDLKAELAELRERARWIPVSERLPEDGRSVLLYDRLISGVELATYEKGKWYLGGGSETTVENAKDIFTYWQHLPEPPEDK